MSSKKPYYKALADANEQAAAIIQTAVVAISERATGSNSETQESICQWAEESFGTPASRLSIAKRANMEMVELLDRLALDDNDSSGAEEAADIVIVLQRLFESYGTTQQEEVNKKMAINRSRKWIRSGTGHGQHVKED
jgi:hypothetical protein